MQKSHWGDLAAKWSRIGSPLRPCGEDVEIFRQALGPDNGTHLLLGVTPELAAFAGRTIAIDHNAAMIDAIWPGNHAQRSVVRGNWLNLPFAPDQFDTALCDGGLTQLSCPTQYADLFAQLARVLKPGGRILLRLFLSPEQGETSTEVCSDALAGNIRGFHAFKWRLAMAVAAEAGNINLPVSSVYAAFERLLPDRARLAAASGWAAEDIATIDPYRDSPMHYSYPTLSQFRAMLPHKLKEIAVIHGRYELAERCPIVALECRKE
ncbi:MAG: class I SAM-dependent methyltransferase [Nitrosomonadales bacterium]|nr:class I SAM-dependent methyltransferase [Nitrosomonadales bacterium]